LFINIKFNLFTLKYESIHDLPDDDPGVQYQVIEEGSNRGKWKLCDTQGYSYNNELKKLSIFINSYWCFVDVYSVQVIYLGWKCRSCTISPSSVIAEGEISLMPTLTYVQFEFFLASRRYVHYLAEQHMPGLT
jgi:hypothetical protein